MKLAIRNSLIDVKTCYDSLIEDEYGDWEEMVEKANYLASTVLCYMSFDAALSLAENDE